MADTVVGDLVRAALASVRACKTKLLEQCVLGLSMDEVLLAGFPEIEYVFAWMHGAHASV